MKDRPIYKFQLNIIFSIILITIVLEILSISTVYGQDNVKILSHSSYIDRLGFFTIVGEVQNNSNNTVEYATVHATLYYNNGKVVGTRNGFLANSYLEPNAKSSFTIQVVDASIPLDQIGNYTLGISLH